MVQVFITGMTIARAKQRVNGKMDNQQSSSGQGSGANDDRTPIHVVDNCDDGREWTSSN